MRAMRRDAPAGLGIATAIFRTWDAQEGARCRLCPRELCNLIPVPGTSTATCLMIVEGDALPGLPSAVVLLR